MNDTLKEIQNAFIGFTKRAEKNTSEILEKTFVDSAPLMNSLATKNNQVVYGRRGTGKTHALKYLAQKLSSEEKHPIYIDLRSLGSDGALYHDVSKPVSERSVRLILDLLGVVSDGLYGIALDKISDAPHPDQITNRLDDLNAAISDVKIVGETTLEERRTTERNKSDARSRSLGIENQEIATSIGSKKEQQQSDRVDAKVVSRGHERVHIEFGRVQGCLGGLSAVLGKPEIWLLIDEWSEVPLDLQPHLADLLRRTILPLDGFVLKIAAIEHRSRFHIPRSGGEYIGLELGADVSADLNLDDFLVFDNDQKKAVDFFKILLFRHYEASVENPSIKSADDLIKLAFSQIPAFEEFVRAVEGVPRDALNLAAKLATKSYGRTFAMADVRAAARDWYQQDKAVAITTNHLLGRLMGHIVATVIGQRRARAFLFSSNSRNEHIDRLFDARVLHLLKRNISSKEEPGKRFDVFKIDYGCYVDLINTQRAPRGLFETSDGDFVEVPADDYRSIRRAVLSEDELNAFINGTSSGTVPDALAT